MIASDIVKSITGVFRGTAQILMQTMTVEFGALKNAKARRQKRSQRKVTKDRLVKICSEGGKNDKHKNNIHSRQDEGQS